MISNKITALTIPLFPYLPEGLKKPPDTKRIRPRDSLYIHNMLKELRKSRIATFEAGGKPWLLLSVYSSYSPDIHTMLIEASPNRYIPGPETISINEGNQLMGLMAQTLNIIAKRKSINTIHIGYNWSPRSWGKEEEKTGFQSLPTKWHPHLWGWPHLDKISNKNTWVRKVKTSSLSPEQRRLLGDNDYARPFGLLIKKRMQIRLSKNSVFSKFFPISSWKIDRQGIYTRFNMTVPQILNTPCFFSCCLKPLAVMLEEIMRELTQALTTIRCKEIDDILAQTAKGFPKGINTIGLTPIMRDEKTIKKNFKRLGYPDGLLKALLRPVWNRCQEKGNPSNWWRKGFAYALILSGPAKGIWGELRIMPGVYIGPGGVVEAEGVIIRRPEDKKFSMKQIRQKSEDLRKLAQKIKNFGL